MGAFPGTKRADTTIPQSNRSARDAVANWGMTGRGRTETTRQTCARGHCVFGVCRRDDGAMGPLASAGTGLYGECMRITAQVLDDLENALKGGATCSVAEEEAERFHVGAVWYGDWRHSDGERSFGTEEKPKHNATIARKNKPRTIFRLCPITSRRRGKKQALRLPAGMVPGGKYTESYLLTRIQLIARRDTLSGRFFYKCSLPADVVGNMRELMSHGQQG
jgi:hypothetical protein